MPNVSDNQAITLTSAPSKKALLLDKMLDKMLSLRLMEMGCLPGMQIEKLRTAPSKGLVLIKIYPNGSLLAIRYEDAEKVMVSLQ